MFRRIVRHTVGWFARTRPPRSLGWPASTQSAFRLGAGIMAPVCQNTSKHNSGHEILFGRPVTPRDASPSSPPRARLEALQVVFKKGGREGGREEAAKLVLRPRDSVPAKSSGQHYSPSNLESVRDPFFLFLFFFHLPVPWEIRDRILKIFSAPRYISFED